MRKLFTMAGIGVLSMLMGIPALVWAQDDKPPRQEEPKQEEPKAEPHPDARQQEKPQKQDEMKPPKQEEEKPPKHEDKQQHEQAQQPERPQYNQARPANGKGGRIPDDQFRAHFGRSHTVVIRQPVIVEGQPRFQYSGYWFAFSDPWPVGWAYTDDCYIDYIDGEYFLFDLAHPGVRIALFVVM